MPTVAEHRADLVELVRLAEVDLEVLWQQVRSAAVAEDMLGTILPGLTRTYGQAAGTLAAEWYEDLRADLDIDGRFRAIVAELPDLGRTESLARWATEPLRIDPSPEGAVTARTRASGGLQRIIANASRETVMGSSLADPRAAGWKRVTGARACGFCRMLADRGAVYSEDTVNFGAHDHCGCMAMPEFGTAGDAVFTTRRPSNPRRTTEAERARVRAWMAENGY